MALRHGKGGVVKIGSDTVGHVQSWSLEQTVETADSTSMGDDWSTHLPGIKAWSASVDLWSDESDTGQDALTVGASVTVSLYPEGDTSGGTYFSGTATVASIGRSASKGDVISRSVSLTGNGALTSATVA